MSLIKDKSPTSVLTRRVNYELLIAWLLGMLFVAFGSALASPSLKMALAEASWGRAITTTGRVIVTQWRRTDKVNLLKITYGYKDNAGVVYHNTATIARGIGNVNLQPGAMVVVFYRPENKSESRLKIELGSGEWLPLLILGAIEIIAGCAILSACMHRVKQRKDNTLPEGSGKD